MPGREIPLINNEIYHVLNRGVNSQRIFNCERDYWQFLDRIKYYRNNNLSKGYSELMDLPLRVKNDLLGQLLSKKDFLVDIMVFCLMPNHLHFLLKQKVKDGISKFMSNLTNSYTRYYNIRRKRIGPIFQGKFKAVQVISDEQFEHLSRYIHLNPYSAGIVQNFDDLLKYPYSSLPEYLGHQEGFSDTKIIMDMFNDPVAYQEFVFDHADHQRSIEIIKKKLLES